jgi:hypothetical protein
MASKEKTEAGAVEKAPKAKGDKPGKAAPPAAATAPAAKPAAKPAKPKIPKLAAKNKSRLPRKEKKAQQKLAAAKGK